jgi:hypothetical protein
MRPVTPFMAIRTVLRVTSVPSSKSYAVVRSRARRVRLFLISAAASAFYLMRS